MKYAIFLGEGASVSCNAPRQNEIFRDYFLWRRVNSALDDGSEFDDEIVDFFRSIFGLDVINGDLNKMNFPTFDEAIGILDLAIMKNESFKNFVIGDITYDYFNRLCKCRTYLVYMMVNTLFAKLKNNVNNHEVLISNLMKAGINIADDCLFISTNYDTLIDNALINHRYQVNYGINSNVCGQGVKLYKLHGSMNFLFCPTCNQVEISQMERTALDFDHPSRIYNPTRVLCKKCLSLKKSIIVSSQNFNCFSNYFLNSIWNEAEQNLLDVNKLIFLGYSFPDADMHIKYLLKRIEINRMSKLDIIVCNHFTGKNVSESKAERARYDRFFVKNVNYVSFGFDEFVENMKSFVHR